MHQVLLARHLEIAETRSNRAGRWADLHRVRHPVATRMRHPLPPDHELILGRGAEGIAHPAMHPADPNTLLPHGLQQRLELVLLDSTHRPDGDNQVQARKALPLGKRIQRIGDSHRELLIAQGSRENLGDLRRLMPLPAALHDQG